MQRDAGPWRPGSWLQRHAATLVVGALLLACARQAPGPPDPSIEASGFPVGAYTKQFVEPTFGPSVLAWRFEADGRWAEIPLEGAPVGARPIRGRFTIEGDELIITTDYPPGFGASRHAWRMDGDNLWTTYLSSDLPEDADWFAMLDPSPWVPLR